MAAPSNQDQQVLCKTELVTEWQPDRRQLALTNAILFNLPSGTSVQAKETLVQSLISRLQRCQPSNRHIGALAGSIPTALLQDLPSHQLNWQIAVSPSCGTSGRSFLALLMDDRLVICRPQQHDGSSGQDEPTTVSKESMKSSSIEGAFVSIVIPVVDDPEPGWRRMAWSLDSQFLALAYSDGRIDVFDVSHTAQSNSDQTSQQTSALTILPLKSKRFPGAQGPSDPIATLVFTDPISCSRETFGGIHYSYEFLSITYDGIIRSYLFRPFTESVSIEQEQKVPDKAITFYHRFTLPCHDAVLCAAYDPDSRLLCIAGRGSNMVHVTTESSKFPAANVIENSFGCSYYRR
jgi:hypothetical protein